MVDKRIRIILDSKSAEKNAKDLDRAVTGVGGAADKTQFAINKLASAIAGAIAVDRIVAYADAWTNVQNQIRRTVDSEEQLLSTSMELLKVSNDTRSGLEVTSQLYTSLSISTETLGLSQERVIGVTKTINNLFLEAGKGAAETAGAVRQLGQALESGALRGDEFNSVAEGAPGILRAIQKQTGLTRSELRKLAEEGKITAELIVASLESYGESAQEAADKTKRSFEQSTTVARNNAIAFVGASQSIQSAVDLAGDSLVALSENLSNLMVVIGSGAALYVARMIPAIVASTSAQLASAAATAASAKSELSLATGIARRATIEAEATLATLAAARVDLEAAAAKAALTAQYATSVKWVHLHKAALDQQALAQTKVNALTTASAQAALIASGAQARLAQANSVVASSATIAGRAVGVMRGAMAFLGGPLGVAFLAASAIAYFATSADDAKLPVDDLTKSVDELSQAQRELALIQIGEQLSDLSVKADKAGKTIAYLESIQKIQGNSDWAKRILEQKVTLEETNEQIRILIKRQWDLANAQNAAADSVSSGGKIEIPTKKMEGDGGLQDALDRENSARREIESAKNLTKQLQAELDYRTQITQIYRDNEITGQMGYYDQQRALLEISIQEDLARMQNKAIEDQIRRSEAFARAMENEALEREERDTIRAEFDRQEILATEILEQEKTAIKDREKKAREELDKAEWQSRLDNAAMLGGALMQLGQGQSKKIFKIGQTLALAQASVALPSAVLQSFQNGGGYPWGLVPAAAMLATGLKNIQQIRSAGAGLGGGGGGSSPTASLGGGGGGSSIPTTANSTEQVQQKRIIELRGIAPGDMISGEQLASIFESDDNVVVAFENARSDAQRRNVIGVTAR